MVQLTNGELMDYRCDRKIKKKKKIKRSWEMAKGLRSRGGKKIAELFGRSKGRLAGS